MTKKFKEHALTTVSRNVNFTTPEFKALAGAIDSEVGSRKAQRAAFKEAKAALIHQLDSMAANYSDFVMMGDQDDTPLADMLALLSAYRERLVWARENRDHFKTAVSNATGQSDEKRIALTLKRDEAIELVKDYTAAEKNITNQLGTLQGDHLNVNFYLISSGSAICQGEDWEDKDGRFFGRIGQYCAFIEAPTETGETETETTENSVESESAPTELQKKAGETATKKSAELAEQAAKKANGNKPKHETEAAEIAGDIVEHENPVEVMIAAIRMLDRGERVNALVSMLLNVTASERLEIVAQVSKRATDQDSKAA